MQIAIDFLKYIYARLVTTKQRRTKGSTSGYMSRCIVNKIGKASVCVCACEREIDYKNSKNE